MAPSNLKQRTLTCYPFFFVPRPFPLTADQISRATGIERVNENLVDSQWGGYSRSFVAIAEPHDGRIVPLNLARLSRDPLQQIDVEKLKMELLSPGEGKYFAESALMLIDTHSGLALGEYRPEALGILSLWPQRLINKALKAKGFTDEVELRPFPSKTFRDIVLGKKISSYKYNFGRLRADALESIGIGGESVIEMLGKDQVVSLNMFIRIDAATSTTEEQAGLLEGMAQKLRTADATKFEISTEERGVYDLLRDNFEHYSLTIEPDTEGGPDRVREAKIRAMRTCLASRRQDLEGRAPEKYRLNPTLMDYDERPE